MILALIARSEEDNNDIGEEHQHQDSSTVSDAQVEDEEDSEGGSADHDPGERKKLNWGSYLKFVTPIDEDQAKARCNLCNKIYSRRFIRYHINNVHRYGNPLVKCDVCGKEVKKRSLRTHKFKFHPSSERVNCEHCGKNILRDHLKYHINNVHNNPRVKCDVCGKEVKRIGLRTHKLIHSNVDRPGSTKTPCNICGELIQQQNLKRHKRMVHSSEKKNGRYLKFVTPIDDSMKISAKVKCNLCNSIMVRAYIPRHIQSVHGSKVKCDLCGLKVKKGSLRLHKLRIHKN